MHTPVRPTPPAEATDAPSLIGRSDVATVPWVTTALFCAGVIASTLLRPDGGPVSDTVILVLAGIYTANSLAILALQGTRFIQWCATRLEVYVLGGAVFIGVVSLWAAWDGGITSPFFSWPTALVGMYLGLVLPGRWSLLVAATQGLAALGVFLAAPTADVMNATSVPLLFGAGWAGGLVCRWAHHRAARVTVMLSRTDVLTATLNRRGFLEELDSMTARAAGTGSPLALVLVDLLDLSRVNESSGHQAGDELLRWVGTQLGDMAPRHASVGRLSGDDFGICLPADREAAERFAGSVIERLGERIDVRVGLAIGAPGGTDSDALLHTADLALQTAQDVAAVGRLAVHDAPACTPAAHTARLALTFQRLRELGAKPVDGSQGLELIGPARGALAVMSGGSLVATASAAFGAQSAVSTAVALGVGLSWSALLAAASVGLRHPRFRNAATQTRVYAALTVPFGIGTVAIAALSGGIATPIGAIFALKVLADAVVLPSHAARLNAALLLPWLAATALLSPATDLWALPLLAAVIGAAWLLGRVGRAALSDSTGATICATRTDPLTGLLNRQGFAARASEALEHAKLADQPFGLIAFELEGLKAVNRAWGHAAGDDLLLRVARIAQETLPEAMHFARLDGDEFIAVMPFEAAEDAMEAAEHLEDALQLEAFPFVGWSIIFDDGFDLPSLGMAAARRAERARMQRPRLARAASALLAAGAERPTTTEHRAA